jgi:hypothetical protein
VKQSPELLAELGEVGASHPVEVDEEDGVDSGCRGSDNSNRLRICEGVNSHSW